MALAFLLLALCVGPLAAARQFTEHDLMGLYRAGTPVSDGGSRYVVTASIWDEASNKKTQSLYLGLAARGSPDPVPLAAVEHVSDRSPAWSADHATVLFLSSREGGLGIWAADPAAPTKAAARVATLPVQADNLRISPDGAWVAFSAQVYPGLSLEQTAQRDAEQAASRTPNAHVFDGLFVRRWDEWWTGKFVHVFVAPLKCVGGPASCAADLSRAVDVMGDMRGDCPSRPSGGPEEFAWAPTSDAIAFTTQVGRDIAWSTDLNVYEWTLAKRTAVCLSCSNTATDTCPAYSPDGATIAYLAMETPGYESDTKHIVLYDRKTGRKMLLAADWDRSVDKVQWTADSRTLIASAADRGRQSVFSVDVATGSVSSLVFEHSNDGVNLIPCYDDKHSTCMLFERNDVTHPADVWATDASGTPYQLTNFNRERLQGVEFTQSSEFTYVGANGDQIQAWTHLPRGWTAGRKFPLVLYIHGGPESPWFDAWSYRWNPQVVAGRGYAVLAPNFHGSGSFGSNFTRSILLDWGGKPFEDLMKGVKAYAAANPWVDTSRVGAMGASYGGYMINWLNGNTDGQFKCLVCHDGLFDTVDKYYGTDELFFSEMEFGGPPFDPVALENYRKWSPSTFAANFKTPELIVQGGKDFRIPETSGLSTFNLLQRKGVPSKLVYFANENHWCTEPNDSLLWHAQTLGWLDQWLQK